MAPTTSPAASVIGVNETEVQAFRPSSSTKSNSTPGTTVSPRSALGTGHWLGSNDDPSDAYRDGINGVFGALNPARDEIAFVQARYEEMAAFMASAYANFSGKLPFRASRSKDLYRVLRGLARRSLAFVRRRCSLFSFVVC